MEIKQQKAVILFINFILDKYILKTQYKCVSGKELEYSKEKNKFNEFKNKRKSDSKI